MPWLERLDARAKAWPAVARWPYRSLKWLLIVMGIYLACGLAYVEIVQEHRIGLGTGIAAATLLAVIKGTLTAFRRSSPASLPPH